MPKLQDVRAAFKGIALTGAYEVRWLDYKHVLIHLSNEQDFNRIWTKQNWFIATQKMRVFKWTPEFEPEKESAVVPVWISFPNLKAHLFEKSALLLIAKTVGKPLFVDEATANGSRPSVARVCVEYDCRKSPVDQVWIVVQNRKTGEVMNGYSQRVEFAQMPAYCDHCCHVGHKETDCILLGNKPRPPGTSKPPTSRIEDGERRIGLKEDAEFITDKRKTVANSKKPENGKILYHEEPSKYLQMWQLVYKGSTSGVKDRQGKEVKADKASKEENILVSNRFHTISEEKEDDHNRTTQNGKEKHEKNNEKDEGGRTEGIRRETTEERRTGAELQTGNGKPEGGRKEGTRRETTEERRIGAEIQTGNGTPEGTEMTAIPLANSQILEDTAQGTLHENGVHGQLQNHVEERDKHAERENGNPRNSQNKKNTSKSQQKDNEVQHTRGRLQTEENLQKSNARTVGPRLQAADTQRTAKTTCGEPLDVTDQTGKEGTFAFSKSKSDIQQSKRDPTKTNTAGKGENSKKSTVGDGNLTLDIMQVSNCEQNLNNYSSQHPKQAAPTLQGATQFEKETEDQIYSAEALNKTETGQPKHKAKQNDGEKSKGGELVTIATIELHSERNDEIVRSPGIDSHDQAKTRPSENQERAKEFVGAAVEGEGPAATGSVPHHTPYVHVERNKDVEGQNQLMQATPDEPLLQKDGQIKPSQSLKNNFIKSSTQASTLRQAKGCYMIEYGSGVHYSPVDTLEGSGEHVPIEEEGTSQTPLQTEQISTAFKIIRAGEMRVDNDLLSPNLESASSKCLFNKEPSDIPSFSGNNHADLEVHPRERRRRYSDNAIPLRNTLSTATEEAIVLGGNEEDSDGDSISKSRVIQRRIKKLQLMHRLKILAILEPMVDTSKAEYFRRKMGFEKVIVNNSQKIWLFHSVEFICEVLLDHPQCLHVRVTIPWLDLPIFTTFVYAKCTRSERTPLWNCLRNLAADMEGPWIVGGDFNIILKREERLYGADPHEGSIEDFASVLLDCGLLDGGFEGNPFTWTNNRMFQRLDRMVYNQQWINKFPITRIQHLNRDGSDHCPLLLSCSNSSEKAPSSFRFLHAWALHHNFNASVEGNWNLPINGSGLMAFWSKQKRLKQHLKWWNKTVFGDIFSNIKEAEKRVEECEILHQQEQTIGSRIQLNKSYAQLNKQLSMEEIFWKQKSGVKWVVEGERNTKFFHMRMQKKRIRSHIFKIQEQDGNWIEDPEQLQQSAIDFFSSLLKAESCDDTRFQSSLCPSIISDTDNGFLCAEPTLQEVKEAVFGIDPESAAGPDGFSSHFYQQCWDIIAHDLFEAVKEFFHGADIPQGMTSTTLVLIPKTTSASKWSEFRPISLCTVMNKIITKILANRLAKILPSIITENQSGFVGGRLISDNILLAQELIGKLDQKNRGGNVALKLDMMKAYDRLDWSFLFKVLQHLGFNAQWIGMIQKCISNCWFSLLLNGRTVGYFKSERGLRQGDSISPQLFILAAEYLARGLNALYDQYPSLHYSSGCSLSVSHLAFADDVIIFANGSKSALQKIMAFLQEYEKLSGQRINPQKSCVVTHTNMASSRRQIILQATGFSHRPLPITYLGAPLYKGHKKVMLFNDLVAKIEERITGWENKTLSPGGRITLLRSTLSSLPIYLLQVLKPPVIVLERINRLLNNFLWGGSTASKRIHWASWGKIALPIAEGGLDIRNVEDVCEAFSMKLWWRFRTTNSLWTQFMRAKYCGGQLPTDVQPKLHDSQTWKRMVTISSITEQNIRWRIGHGELFFWHDCWMGEEPLVNRNQAFASSMAQVSDFFLNNSWNVEKLKTVLQQEVVEEIVKIPIDTSSNDKAYWTTTPNGDFSTKSAWQLIRNRKVENPVFNFIWHKSVPLTTSFFLWRLLHDWIPVELKMKTKGFQLASRCRCCKSEESLMHVMWKNPVANQVWSYFAKVFQIQIINPCTINQIICAWFYSGDYSKPGHIRTLVPLFTLWFLWVERNDAKHRNLGMYPNRVVWKILKLLHQLFQGKQLQKWQWQGDKQIAQEWGIILKADAPSPPKLLFWLKPSIGELKLNVDGSCKHNPQSAAGGGLLRDHTGSMIFGFSENFGPQDSLQAELMALHRGLLLCIEHNISRLWIEMDAKVAVQMIKEGHQGSSRTRYLLASIHRCLSGISFRISHIFREGNQAADHLSNQGHTHQNLQVISQAEGQLRGILRLEKINLAYVRFK
ncbi:Uncharacterized protein TCM_036737 [Theobroma cacao]|uniref:Reverse transcriptase domain-containing protein n=1 Tax=Theobroma cacao TaxID=3641 RepID=A0A061FKS1_THECC|nr:Uncharacterized protein TCM_036737 [Theobroma cacao]